MNRPSLDSLRIERKPDTISFTSRFIRATAVTIFIGLIVTVPVGLALQSKAAIEQPHNIVCYSNGNVIFEGQGSHVQFWSDGNLEFKDLKTGRMREIRADCMVER